MKSRKIILVQGLGELAKLEFTGGSQLYNYVVENCHLRFGRLPMVAATHNGLKKTVIVKATAAVTVVCQLAQNETAPVHLPRVRWAYI